MNIFGYSKRATVSGLLALSLMVALFASQTSQGALAQSSDSSYQFASGQNLEWTGDWALDPESTVEQEGLELVLLSRQLSFLAVMSVPAGYDMNLIRDTFLEGFLETGENSTTIDRGAYGAVSYSLDTITYEEIGMGAFTLLRAGAEGSETFAWIFVSPIPKFASEFASVQGAFTLDGAAPFDGVDGIGLQDQLAAAPVSGGSTAPEVETPMPENDQITPTPENQATEPAGGNGNDGNPAGLKGGRGASTDDSTPGSDGPGVLGLIDDNTFVSPTYGSEIQWNAPLGLDTERDTYVLENSDGRDFVALIVQSDSPAFVTVSIIDALGDPPGDIVDVWTSPDYLSNNEISPGSEVVLSESSSSVGAVARVDATENGTPLIVYSEVRYDDTNDTLVLIEFVTATQLFGDTFMEAQGNLTLNGEPVLGFFTPDEIAEAAGI